jgi:hypothetical protein
MKHLINERSVLGFAVQRTIALFILITLLILALPHPLPASRLYPENPYSGGNSMVGRNDFKTGDNWDLNEVDTTGFRENGMPVRYAAATSGDSANRFWVMDPSRDLLRVYDYTGANHLSEIPGLVFPTNRAIHDHLGKMSILAKSPNTDLSGIKI